jgi:hypothetical protein
MSNPRELALQLAAVTLLADVAKAERDRLRAALAVALDEAGADGTRAEVAGERIAKVSLVQPSAKPGVHDEAAFTNHVAANRPDEVVRSVRESYRRVYLDSLQPTSSGEAVDPATGELVPGVRYHVGTAYITTRFDKGGRDALANALRTGTYQYSLPTHATPQLTGTDDE